MDIQFDSKALTLASLRTCITDLEATRLMGCNRCRMWTLAEEQPETWQPVANPLPSDCRCVYRHHSP
jgi:hypothetical protein